METFFNPRRAPEIFGDFWFNAEPFSIQSMRGNILLIDFWDYCDQNSLRALPYLQEWNRRYAEFGFVIVGIHAPRFPFAKDPATVKKAVGKLGIRYPVVLDNEFLTWSAFQVRLWPTKFLIDKNGFIRYRQEGEGFYQDIEHTIHVLLNEVGFHGELPLTMEPVRDTDAHGAVCYRATPEILTGYQRGTIGNIEGYYPESVMDYHDPDVYIPGRIYLNGSWLLERNFVKLEGAEGNEGHVILTYAAREVNTVIKPEGEKNFQVFVMQDDVYLTPENKGDDVKIDAEGRSFLLIDEAHLYNVVKNREFGEHKLRFSTRSNGFALYAVSFVSGVIPEFVAPG